MSVELSAFLNSSNDHNKLPKQAEWLSFDYFFESIWEAKAQEKHNTRQIAKAKSPFWKSARLREGSSFCLICIDFCSDNVLYLLILSGGPEFILLNWSLCPTVTSSHIDILAHAQIVGLFIKQHFTSGKRSNSASRLFPSPVAEVIQRQAVLMPGISDWYFPAPLCFSTLLSKTFAPKQWARPWVSSPPERLNRSMIYQMNWIWVEKHKLIKLEESQPPWHLVKCFTSAANCVLWSFRTQLLSFAVLRLFGAIVLVTKTSAQVGSSWHHMNHETTAQFDTIPTSTRSVKAIFHQTDRTNYLSAKALVHPASHRPSVSSEVTKK
jgi:hypothetical protein